MNLEQKLEYIKTWFELLCEQHRDEIKDYVGHTAAADFNLKDDIDTIQSGLEEALTTLSFPETPCTVAEADYIYENAREID